MNKVELEKFIEKYNLDGLAETVLWNVDEDNNLNVDLMTPEKNCIGSVKAHSQAIKDGFSSKLNNYEVGINQTTYLKKMLDVLNDEVNVEVKTDGSGDEVSSLIFKDNNTSVKFTACEKGIVPTPKKLSKSPEFEAELEIDTDFIERFIKSFNSLKSDQIGPTFAFIYEGGKTASIVLDYAENMNKNNISLSINEISNKEIEEKMIIDFPGKNFMKALKANKDFDDATFKISSKGLLYLEFQNDITLSKYYIVKTSE